MGCVQSRKGGAELLGCLWPRFHATHDSRQAGQVEVDVGVTPLGVLLITNNVSGVFDNVRVRIPHWVSQLGAVIDAHQPDVIAIHLQEVGGTDWRRTGLQHLGTFIRAVIDKFPQFWCSGFMCDTRVSEEFTALGAIFLVRNNAMHRVRIWEFSDGTGSAGSFVPVKDLPSPLLPNPCAAESYCRLAQFPHEMFPEGKLSRKGYLMTRWQLAGKLVDLVNIHNMHDELNTQSVRQEALSGESRYAIRRRECLQHTLRAQQKLSAGFETACFVFGDFNFRLNMAQLIKSMCGQSELERAQSINGDEQSIKLKDASSDAPAIEFGPKRFLLVRPEKAMERKFFEFSQEVQRYAEKSENKLKLYEFPVVFPPSYNYDPDAFDRGSSSIGIDITKLIRRGSTIADAGVLRGISSLDVLESSEKPESNGQTMPVIESHREASFNNGTILSARVSSTEVIDANKSLMRFAQLFNPKRCPAWCDRVLMTHAAYQMVQQSKPPPVYSSYFQQPVVTDHNLVCLWFVLHDGASSTSVNGGQCAWE
ncbi:hypothetical protein AB1Y20_012708 [Prymnesium parvum]|uniref:inositol-polyphosphate 5-phosphatase n=1 Tax=Prymnesium parvum TaxID=97485 RepID=A0AB34IL28_PRYPA